MKTFIFSAMLVMLFTSCHKNLFDMDTAENRETQEWCINFFSDGSIDQVLAQAPSYYCPCEFYPEVLNEPMWEFYLQLGYYTTVDTVFYDIQNDVYYPDAIVCN